MKILVQFTVLFLISTISSIDAQIVKDPLLDHYQSVNPTNSPQEKIYYFEANFTEAGRKSVFITDDGEYLGAHGKYAWAVYVPSASEGYESVTNSSHFIAGGLSGPGYIGYIPEIRKYGIVTTDKYGIGAQYLENGILKNQTIEESRDRLDAEHYPKYYGDKAPDYHVITYTMEQLNRKYPGVAKSLPSPSEPPKQITPPSQSPSTQAPILMSPPSSNSLPLTLPPPKTTEPNSFFPWIIGAMLLLGVGGIGLWFSRKNKT